MDYSSKEFEARYHYDGGDLGVRRTDRGTAFALWSPPAEAVTLRLYDRGDGGEAVAVHPLTRTGRGVWRYEDPADLTGRYYDFLVTAAGETRSTADPYARACGVNGSRSMVVDLAATDPEGWAGDRPPARQAEDIIYEVHVKEFSWQSAGGFPARLRGKYLAFTCGGTTLDGQGTVPTGLSHLRDLGVTHVQLMPVFDFGSVDEAGPPEANNWGYDPVNYNVPEGSYATDARDGAVRIRELKALVAALHRAGFRVIMDVVYNHTYRRDSWLERAVPGYYYRTWPDGTPSDGSLCGNDLATERSMTARYIVDSILYWATEYHMDGFRLDLMGLMDTALVERVRGALDGRFGRGEKLVYGEPWSGGKTALTPGFRTADKQAISDLDREIGAFCDQTRDAVKGSVLDAGAGGFVNGGAGFEAAVLRGLTAWVEQGCFRAPSQVITYLSCHDDLTLWDKLRRTLDPAAGDEDFPPRLLAANRLAAALCCCCQGRLFLLSGEEFCRTKGGRGDVYNAPIAFNRLDWTRLARRQDMAAYYRGLFALRKQIPAFCDKGPDAARWMADRTIHGPGQVSALAHTGGGPWTQVFLLFNAADRPLTLPLPPGDWTVLADGESSFRWRSPAPVSEAAAAPHTALLLGRRD